MPADTQEYTGTRIQHTCGHIHTQIDSNRTGLHRHSERVKAKGWASDLKATFLGNQCKNSILPGMLI